MRRSNCAADQRLCFRYTESTISLYYLNPKFQASSHLLWLYSPVCVGPSWIMIIISNNIITTDQLFHYM